MEKNNDSDCLIHIQWGKGDIPHSLAEEWGRLERILKEEGIETVVVALNNPRNQCPLVPLLFLRVTGVRVVEAVSYYEEISGRVPVWFLTPNDFVFSNGFKRSKAILQFERGLDIVFSILGLLGGVPILLVAAVFIKLDSKGPIFYSQKRVGLNGKLFKILKLRTMSLDAEKHTGPVYAEENDSRITGVGRFLRKYRLDEIPQMFNVLSGEMSFVGPRPERPVFVESLEKEIPFYALRHMVKPGITGWAQTRCHYASTPAQSAEKLEHDLYYIKHLSLFLDLKIILDTFRVVLTGHGAR